MLIHVNYSSLHAFAIYRELGFVNTSMRIGLLHNLNITHQYYQSEDFLCANMLTTL